jgi:predicted enzyme related to lactoylglutathione lyase
MADTSDRGAFIWYELISGDPAKAKAFYDAVVGWTIDTDGQQLPTGSTYRMIKRSDGGKLLGDPQEIPGGEYSVYGHDPEGATFGLVGPRKER